MPLFDFTKPAPDFAAIAAEAASRGLNDKPDRTGGASLDLPALVDRYANKYGLPPEWGMAKLHVESGFNPKARAKTSSATGLTQVLDAARKDYNKAHGKNLTREDLMDPETSLDAGFWYWAKMPGNTPFEKSMAYFAGPHQKDPKVLKKAAEYARKIERLAARYSKRTGRRLQPQRRPDFGAIAAEAAGVGSSTPAPAEELGFPSAAFADAVPDFAGMAARAVGAAAPEAATGATQTGTAPTQVPVPGMAPHVQKEMDRSLGSIKTITGMVPRVMNAPVNVPRHGPMTPEQFRIGLKNGEFQLTQPEINKVLNEIGGVDPETLEYAVKNEVQTMRNLGGANALSQKTGLPVDTSEIKPPLEEDSILPGSFQKILWALGTPQSALVAPINRLLQGGATAKDLQDEFLSPFRGEKLTSWRSVLDTLFPDQTWGTLDPNAFFDNPKTKKLKEAGYLPMSPLSFTGKGFVALLMDAIFDPANAIGVGLPRNIARLSDGLVLSAKGKERLVKGIRTIMDAAPKDLDEAGRAAHQYMARRLAEDSLKLAVDAGDNTLVAKGGVRIAGLQVPLTAEAANLTKEIIKKGAQQVRKSPQGRFVADEMNKFISKFERDWLVKAKVYRDYVKDKHEYFNFIKANRQELLDRAQVVFAPLKKWEREAVTDAVEAGAIDNPVWVTLGERYADGPTGAPMYRTREIVPTDEMRKAAKAVAQDQLNWRNVENSLGIGGGFLENYMMRRWKNYPAVREAAQARFGTWMRANQHKPLADLTTLEMMDLVPELEPATRDAMELYLMRGMSSIRAQSAYHFIGGTLMKYGKDFNRTGDWMEDMRYALQNGYKAPPRVVTLGREYEIAGFNPMFDKDGNPIPPQGTMPTPSGAAPAWTPNGPVQNPPGGPAQPPPAPPSGAVPVSDATPPDPPAPPRGFEPSDPSSAPPPTTPPPPPAPPAPPAPPVVSPAAAAPPPPPPQAAPPRPAPPRPPAPPAPAAPAAPAPIAMLPDQIMADLKKKAVERTGIEGVADKIIEGKSPEELAQMLGDFDKTPMPQWLAEAVMDDKPAVPPAPPVSVSPQVQQVVAKEYKKYEGLRLANQDILPSMKDRFWTGELLGEENGMARVKWDDGKVTRVALGELRLTGPGSPGGNAPLTGPLGRRGPLRAPKDDYASAVASGSNPKILAAAAKKADEQAASPVYNQAAKGRNLSDLTLEDLMAERAALQGEGYANDFGDPFGPGNDLEDEIVGPGREAMRNKNLQPQEVPPVGIPKDVTPENMPGWGPGENGPVNPNMPNEIDNYKKMLKWMVPGPIADDMLTVADPAEASSLWRGFDRVTGAIKTSMTIPFPAFHIRNAMGNIANAFLDIGIQALNPRRHMMAIDVLRGNKAGKMLTETGEEFTYQYLRQRFRTEGLEGAFHGRLDIIQTPEGQILGAKAPPFWRSLGRAVTGKDSIRNVHPIQRMGQAVGENLEEEARMHLFLTYIRRGDSIDEAARRVKQVLFDYDHLTPFEKRWMRRAIPFYTWTRKNIPYQMRKVLEEPGRYQALAEIYTQYGDRDQIEQQLRMFPPYMSHQLGRQIGYDTVGNPLFAVGFGIPIEDLQRLFPQIRSSESRSGEFMRMNVLAMLHPFFRAVIEEAANKDMYLDRPLDELNTMYDIWGKAAKQMPEFIQKSIGFKEETNARGDVVYKMDPRKLHIVRSFILSRIYSTVGKAFDERKDWGTRALNTLTGMTITSVDWETQILPAIRNRTWERKEASEHQFKQQVRAFRFRDPVNPFAGESVSANELIGKPDPLPAKKVIAQTPDVTNALQRGQLKAADLAETARQGTGG